MGKCPFSNSSNGKNMKDYISVFIAFIFVVFFMVVILALPVMLLWNYILPEITYNKIKQINFFQALALNLLCFILFRTKNFERNIEK